MPETMTEETLKKSPAITGIDPKGHQRALRKISPPEDRPGWIPREIKRDWDKDPYAYQTEEELMPAGGLHGELMGLFAELLRAFLESKGLRFLMDTFMLYRDRRGVKQRISPDFLIMPFRSPPPSAYDLDAEPPPLAVVEITSPKSHVADKKKKVRFYMDFGIPAYLVIDAITQRGKPRDPIQLTLWRKTDGEVRKIRPDADGYLPVPELFVKIKAEGRKIVVADIVTGEILRDSAQLRESEARERQRAERLAAKLREMGVSPDEME